MNELKNELTIIKELYSDSLANMKGSETIISDINKKYEQKCAELVNTNCKLRDVSKKLSDNNSEISKLKSGAAYQKMKRRCKKQEVKIVALKTQLDNSSLDSIEESKSKIILLQKTLVKKNN